MSNWPLSFSLAHTHPHTASRQERGPAQEGLWEEGDHRFQDGRLPLFPGPAGQSTTAAGQAEPPGASQEAGLLVEAGRQGGGGVGQR